MNKTVKISTAAIFIMFFATISISAQKHSKTSKTGHQMMKNMQMNCDSTMMQKHMGMMKDGKMDSTMMKNHKGMMMKHHKEMMKDGKIMCDTTMMKNHKDMMGKNGMMNHKKAMMKNHKGMMMKHHKKMMEDGKMTCDTTMMKNRKGMMGENGMMNHKKGMMQNNKGMMNHDKMMGNNMIHKGVIDVNAIDINKDGKVYQDMMDWNVISDKPGKCPNCGMKLKEVSIDKAKKNLRENGFNVK